jgi:hypothetical protein
LAALALTAFMLVPWPHTLAAGTTFDVLLGSWRGTGQIVLSDGKAERLKCNAYYTGGGSQLGMAIRCQSESSNVEIRSKLSQAAAASPARGKSAPSMRQEPPPDRPQATGSASRSAAA